MIERIGWALPLVFFLWVLVETWRPLTRWYRSVRRGFEPGAESVPQPFTYKWGVCFRCTSCKHDLSDDQVMQSSGVCPYCGATSRSTIVDHEKSSVRLKREVPGGPLVREYKEWVRE